MPALRPVVRMRLSDGRSVEATPGTILGRGSAAGVPFPHLGVSEAHALVSLRGGALRLLALRGRLCVDDEEEDDIILEPGQRIQLAHGVEVLIEDVELPGEVTALMMPDQPPRELCAPTYSLLPAPLAEWVAREVRDAAAVILADGPGWTLMVAGRPPEPLVPGRAWTVEGVTFGVANFDRATFEVESTRSADALRAPVDLVVSAETVTVRRRGVDAVTLTGRPGQLLASIARRHLAGLRAPTWEAVAGELWPVTLRRGDLRTLRRNYDRAVARLRSSLREAGLPSSLVRLEGSTTQLSLGRGDQVVPG